MATKLILDVDTGTDDAVALMLAELHPDLDLVGVTTVTGNVLLDITTENTLRVFDHIGRSVPVYRGIGKPLAREDLPTPRATPGPGWAYVHGEYLDIPPATSKVADASAVEFLIETYRAATDEIVLVPTGPLTNIAAAIRLEPKLVDLIPRTVIMGGAHYTGNLTPRAEFNVWADAEAAQVVFRAGLRNVTLVTLDATHKALVSLEDCKAFRALGTPAGDATATFVERRIHGYDDSKQLVTLGAAPVHDALCVAYLLQPDVISIEPLHVDVETQGLAVGETIIDVRKRGGQEPNMNVALDADDRAMVELLLKTFAVQ